MLTSISLKIAALASFVLLASGSCNLCKANHKAAKQNTQLLIKQEQIKIGSTQSHQRLLAEGNNHGLLGLTRIDCLRQSLIAKQSICVNP